VAPSAQMIPSHLLLLVNVFARVRRLNPSCDRAGLAYDNPSTPVMSPSIATRSCAWVLSTFLVIVYQRAVGA